MDRYGDLGHPSESSIRVAVVWENLLAFLPPERQAAEARALRWSRWKRAFRMWDENQIMRHAVHDMAWRRGVCVDVVITHPEGFAQLVSQHLEDTNYDCGRVYNASLAEFERMLPHLPEIVTVFHGEQGRPFLFGSKGVLANGPSALGRMFYG